MWIESEPGDMLMTRYFLCFQKEAPNPEDHRIRAFLREQNLHPKRIRSDERGGIRCEVLQFGQCYLGYALQAVVALQQRGMVAESVAFSLDTDDDLRALVGETDRTPTSDLAWIVAGKVLEGDAIRPAPDNPDQSIIDLGFLREAVRQAVAELSAAAIG